MTRAIVMRTTGGPEVLRMENVEVGNPGAGQARIRQTAAGVNFHDIYVRTGLYKTLTLPGIPGLEAIGVVEAIGSGITHLKVGDRVGCLTREYQGYAEMRLAPADEIYKIPDSVDDGTAAATLLRGLTALMLVRYTHRIEPGLTVLVHAASGGVGQLLCQWAHQLGARVIGTVGSEEKARVARENGCDEIILYRSESFVDRVRAITGGRGVDVAYDAVGKDTFLGSMECLALRGHLINFGQSSGPVDPLPMALLFRKSNSVTRPGVFHYLDTRERRDRMAGELFDALAKGVVRPAKPIEYRLEDAGRAQQDLEERRTAGAVILRM